jgi:hypothetical protein
MGRPYTFLATSTTEQLVLTRMFELESMDLLPMTEVELYATRDLVAAIEIELQARGDWEPHEDV